MAKNISKNKHIKKMTSAVWRQKNADNRLMMWEKTQGVKRWQQKYKSIKTSGKTRKKRKIV